jgi:hypothetical protein
MCKFYLKLNDDFILSTADLSKKYANQAMEKIKTIKGLFYFVSLFSKKTTLNILCFHD